MKTIDISTAELKQLHGSGFFVRVTPLEPQPEDGHYHDEYRETRHPFGPIGTEVLAIAESLPPDLAPVLGEGFTSTRLILTRTEVNRMGNIEVDDDKQAHMKAPTWCWIDTLKAKK